MCAEQKIIFEENFFGRKTFLAQRARETRRDVYHDIAQKYIAVVCRCSRERKYIVDETKHVFRCSPDGWTSTCAGLFNSKLIIFKNTFMQKDSRTVEPLNVVQVRKVYSSSDSIIYTNVNAWLLVCESTTICLMPS